MMSEETVSEKARRDPFEHFQPIGRKKHDRSLQLEKSCTEPGARRNAKAVEWKDAGNQALLVHTEYDSPQSVTEFSRVASCEVPTLFEWSSCIL